MTFAVRFVTRFEFECITDLTTVVPFSLSVEEIGNSTRAVATMTMIHNHFNGKSTKVIRALGGASGAARRGGGVRCGGGGGGGRARI